MIDPSPNCGIVLFMDESNNAQPNNPGDGPMERDEFLEYKKAYEAEFARTLKPTLKPRTAQDVADYIEAHGVEAAEEIFRIAKHGTVESARLRAAQYIVDRVLGPNVAPSAADEASQILQNLSD